MTTIQDNLDAMKREAAAMRRRAERLDERRLFDEARDLCLSADFFSEKIDAIELLLLPGCEDEGRLAA